MRQVAFIEENKCIYDYEYLVNRLGVTSGFFNTFICDLLLKGVGHEWDRAPRGEGGGYLGQVLLGMCRSLLRTPTPL